MVIVIVHLERLKAEKQKIKVLLAKSEEELAEEYKVVEDERAAVRERAERVQHAMVRVQEQEEQVEKWFAEADNAKQEGKCTIARFSVAPSVPRDCPRLVVWRLRPRGVTRSTRFVPPLCF